MKKILWISLRAPYDSVLHAGGKVHNFYIKEFNKSNKFDIRLISFCYESEVSKLDLDRYNITNDVYVIKKNVRLRNFFNRIGMPISLAEYLYIKKQIKQKLKELQKNSYMPDIVILHWTEIVMLFPRIKKIFPNSKIVAIEEDVTFLKLERKCRRSTGVKHILTEVQRILITRKELYALENADLAVLNNRKDHDLVISRGVPKDKLFIAVPYFENMANIIQRKPKEGNIIFWGAMNRPENIEAVKWFTNHVFARLKDKYRVKFIVIGANPTQDVLKLEEMGVEVTGFVNSPWEYFESCMCMVVPLLMGAGIKIKVLEGMSAGIPILTNDIGIEGIPAEDGRHFIYCKSAQDYQEAIEHLIEDEQYGERIGKNAVKFVEDNFNMDKIQTFIERVEGL